MAKPFRNATCAQCKKDYSYKYNGGRTRKYCPTCKPGKSRRKHQSLDAYDFNWGNLPYPWRFTHRGHPTRWLGPHRLVIYATLDRFALAILLMGNWHGRNSVISAAEENIDRGLEWATTRAQNILDSFEV